MEHRAFDRWLQHCWSRLRRLHLLQGSHGRKVVEHTKMCIVPMEGGELTQVHFTSPCKSWCLWSCLCSSHKAKVGLNLTVSETKYFGFIIAEAILQICGVRVAWWQKFSFRNGSSPVNYVEEYFKTYRKVSPSFWVSTNYWQWWTKYWWISCLEVFCVQREEWNKREQWVHGGGFHASLSTARVDLTHSQAATRSKDSQFFCTSLPLRNFMKSLPFRLIADVWCIEALLCPLFQAFIWQRRMSLNTCHICTTTHFIAATMSLRRRIGRWKWFASLRRSLRCRNSVVPQEVQSLWQQVLLVASGILSDKVNVWPHISTKLTL